MGDGGALIGQVLADRYRIDSSIGEGGMSVVYRALDLEQNQLVAIKVLLASFLEDEVALTRFKLEAKTAGQVRHPNLVTVHHMGEHAGCLLYTSDAADE